MNRNPAGGRGRHDRSRPLVRIVPAAWGIAALLIAGASPLSAQRYGCALRLQPWSDSTGYRLRNNRCEGMYVGLQSGSPIVQVISFVKGGLRYEVQGGAGGDSVLTVRAPARLFPGGRVLVRGSARESNLNWALDAEIPAVGGFRWDLREVVIPHGLGSDRIGLMGEAEAVAEGRPRRFYVPLEIRGSGPPPRSDSTELVVKLQSAVAMRWGIQGTDATYAAQRLNMDGYFRIMLPPADTAHPEQTIIIRWRAREEARWRDIPETIPVYRW